MSYKTDSISQTKELATNYTTKTSKQKENSEPLFQNLENKNYKPLEEEINELQNKLENLEKLKNKKIKSSALSYGVMGFLTSFAGLGFLVNSNSSEILDESIAPKIENILKKIKNPTIKKLSPLIFITTAIGIGTGISTAIGAYVANKDNEKNYDAEIEKISNRLKQKSIQYQLALKA